MCIVIASFIVVTVVLAMWFKDYYIKQIKKQIDDQRAVIANKVQMYRNGFVSYEELEQLLVVTSGYFKADVWVYDYHGFICCVSKKEQQNLLGKYLPKNIRTNGKIDGCYELKTTFENIYNDPVYSLQFPLIRGTTDYMGGVVVNIPFENISGPLNRFYWVIWVAALVVMIGSCIAIYIFSQRTIIKPLNNINTVAKKIAKGEVDKRVENNSEDEIGELSSSFNYMADFLEKIEENRKQFMSNVSHEIRSPITSIKGFIGAMLDGVVPKEKHDYYLQLTYDEIQRLTRLVNELLDLSALQDGKFKLIIDELDINELIRVTVIKFESRVIEKNLNIDVLFHKDKSMVLGDRDKLAQVLTNLLDNAVKYSDESTTISVRVKEKNKKYVVSVNNKCEPIPEEELNKLWQRFYKGDKSRTVKNSSGLGLSIVREILTQLNQEVWVENEDGGVTFSFTLDKVK